jgi:hypothetical protein
MLIGGMRNGQALASVLVLAIDGSKWMEHPPLLTARAYLDATLLPNGRPRKDGELYDPVKQRWKPLPPMAHIHANICAAPISGGAIVLGMVGKESELYDEASGRWYKLPYEMLQRRQGARLASVPAFALLGATPH